MKVTSVKYERVFNMGNYESERIGIEIEPDNSDNIDEDMEIAINKARKFVYSERGKKE